MKSFVKIAMVAAAAMGVMAGTPAVAQRNIVIKGSDTMVILGQAWAEAYMKANRGVNVSVTGGGSGIGIAAFINGTTDIAQSSRAMRKSEIDSAKSRGRIATPTVVGLDGLAVAVNKNNPIKSLTLDQIRDIYVGRINDWSQVGGRPGRIVVLSRDNNSGTYGFFKDTVLKGAAYRADALFLPSTKAIQQEVTNNVNAIGYGGEAYFKGKRNVEIVPVARRAGQEAVYPSNDNVQSGKYPIARPLFFYTNGRPSGEVAKFIQFVLSPAGQEVVGRVGYVPLRRR